MALDDPTLLALIAELSPLVGCRIQRADLIDELELCLELRAPGRTLWLLFSARAGSGRLHLVERRPERLNAPPPLQVVLRKRLLGRPVHRLSADRGVVELRVPGSILAVRIRGGGDPIRITDPDPDPDPDAAPTDLAPGGPAGPALPIPQDFPINRRVAERFRGQTEADATLTLRRTRLREVRQRSKKLQRLQANLEGDRRHLLELLEDRQRGELLKTVLTRVRRGMTEIDVFDYKTDAEIRVPLRSDLDGKANLERFFLRAKKGERGLQKVEARRREVSDTIAELDRDEAKIQAASLEDLRERTHQIQESTGGLPSRPRSRARRSHDVDRVSRKFMTADHREVRVGKGAKENDRLTFAAARGHDLWLHARGVPGAHVVLRLEKEEAPPEESFLDAAHLAVHYSEARDAPKAEVVYTRVKHVSKPRGAPPGQVSVAKERTILLRIEPARVERLFHPPSGKGKQS